MFNIGETIDGKYIVKGLCNDSGGMGKVLYVSSTTSPGTLVLKYCKESSEDSLKRFRREVRIISEFKGNTKIVQIIDFNLESDFPYFVMELYPNGDLQKNAEKIRTDLLFQEAIFLNMIDCVHEMHIKKQFHRDIKPQNFLLDGNSVIISDFGLSVEQKSETQFTNTLSWGGTQGYIPPEFLNAGGFSNASAASDIYMLGKTFYCILKNQDPTYIEKTGINPALYYIIEKCCNISPSVRYENVLAIKQAFVMAYDVILKRTDINGELKQLAAQIIDLLNQKNQFSTDNIKYLIEKLLLVDNDEKTNTIKELPDKFFHILKLKQFQKELSDFLGVYKTVVESKNYSWSYAETIAESVQILFSSDEVLIDNKVKSLILAIDASVWMNRYAAMDVCKEIIKSIKDESLGSELSHIIFERKETFLRDIEISDCKCDSIKAIILKIKPSKSKPA